MRRVSLDANVLFSAAYRDGAGLLALWKLSDVERITSAYAAEEARRNLDTAERRSRLEDLLASVRLVAEAAGRTLPEDVRLPEKDVPILLAAMAAGATHLLTGDLRDFGHLLGRRVGGILVQMPGEFFKGRG
jgi:predicted nucleic acid-binding protein